MSDSNYSITKNMLFTASILKYVFLAGTLVAEEFRVFFECPRMYIYRFESIHKGPQSLPFRRIETA